MSKRIFYFLLTFGLFALPFAEAQQINKIPRIGHLSVASRASIAERTESFRQGLRELGYVEGKNIVLEWRSADGERDRVPGLAAELVRLKVDVIVTGGSGATRWAKEATSTIPIVMAQDNDPIGNGFVFSLARPGANITGLSTLAPERNGKRLELLKEIVPKLYRVAVFGTSTGTGNDQVLSETERVAGALGVALQYVDVLAPKDIESAFREASKRRADAVLGMISGPVYNPHLKQIAELAVKSRLPVICCGRGYVETGGLMNYGVSLADLNRRAATYVHKILKGAKPTDLPVEQPTKFELAINLNAAKQIGLTIPPNVLARADKIIK
jgi:putative ABC transport system substrate-binding protein